MEAPQEIKKKERHIHSSLSDFLHGGFWEDLKEIDQDAAMSFTKVFLDAAHRDLGVAPEDLTADQLREILLGKMPRRISGRRRFSEKATELVECFYKSLAEGRDKDFLEQYKKVFKEAHKKFPALVKEGKGLEDVGELDSPLQREDEKVGRNDPCPCGSGKKYKKCHGQT